MLCCERCGVLCCVVNVVLCCVVNVVLCCVSEFVVLVSSSMVGCRCSLLGPNYHDQQLLPTIIASFPGSLLSATGCINKYTTTFDLCRKLYSVLAQVIVQPEEDGYVLRLTFQERQRGLQEANKGFGCV